MASHTFQAILLEDVRTEAEWAQVQEPIMKDKMCISSDRGYQFKIGDGESLWSELSYNQAKASDVYTWAKLPQKPLYNKEEIGLGNVDNKSSETIRGEITKENVVNALGYTPPQQDTNTTYKDFTGASSSAAGKSGLVPAPLATYHNDRFLKADGTWAVPPNTTYAVVTDDTDGLMSSEDKAKLDGIAKNANNYVHPNYTARNSGLYKVTVDATGHVSAVTAVTKEDITGLGIPAQDTNTTYSNFTGASASAAGKAGLVPAPATGYNSNRFLKADGTWAIPPNTTYGVASDEQDGLMSSEDKAKLDTIEANANHYVHPSYTNRASGLYKVTVDATGHVSAVTAVQKSDITSLGIPSQDTKYSVATSSALGLVKSGGDVTINAEGIMSVGNDTHTHGNSTITSIDASKITGKISIDNLPEGALERLVVVADEEERFGLTTSDVQKGDTVKQNDTGVMYYVKDDTKLTSEDGYEVYTAGQASSVPWSGVTGKPSSFTPSTHTHTIAQISNISSASVASATKATQDADGQDIASTYIKNLSISGKTVTVTRGDGTTFTATTQDTNTTYSNFTGATASAAGSAGLVPAPATGYNSDRFLKADGTWAVPPNTTYAIATSETNGLMSAADKTKLDGIAIGANKYTHPAYTARTSGLYKITVDATGHVSAVTAVAKADITALGIPAQDTNTTYSNATTSAAGLMSAADKTKLDGIATGANKYTLPTASKTTLGGVKTGSDVTSTSGLTPCPIISGIPYYKDTNTTYTLSSFGVTATASELNKLDGCTATVGELNYVHGVTSAIQTQLNGKAPTSHSHTVANISNLYASIYPVGIILPFATSTDPNTVFTGTTWTKVAAGRTLVGAGTLNDGTTSKTFTLAGTGGKYQAKLTTSNLPAHTHSMSLSVKREAITAGSGSTTGYIPATGTQSSTTQSATGKTGSAGSGSGFDILQPYLVVNFWQRTK